MPGQFYTAQGLMALVNNMTALLDPVSFTGVLTAGSNQVTDVSSTAGLQVGNVVVGTGIPPLTAIAGIDPVAETVTLSQNATANSESSLPSALWSFGQETETLPLYEHLLVGNVPQGPYITFADLVEANYEGYAPQQWAYPVVVACQDSANVTFSAQAMTWAPTNYSVGNQITGRAVTLTLPGASGPILIATEQFQPAMELTSTGQGFRTVPTLSLPLDQTAGPSTPVLT